MVNDKPGVAITEPSSAAPRSERPILFSPAMVRAILSGQKTQTRRIAKPALWPILDEALRVNGHPCHQFLVGNIPCPYGEPGDRLWVRETFSHVPGEGVAYRATNPELDGAPWKPSIHMPRWASRITLEITEVRVQRLQDISEDDVYAEGCASGLRHDPFACDGTNDWCFPHLWDSINGGTHNWESNPWVWALSFQLAAQGEPTMTATRLSDTQRASQKDSGEEEDGR